MWETALDPDGKSGFGIKTEALDLHFDEMVQSVRFHVMSDINGLPVVHRTKSENDCFLSGLGWRQERVGIIAAAELDSAVADLACGAGQAPAHGGHGSGQGAGHANSQSGMNRCDEAGAAGAVIGVHSGATLEGIASHPGERVHVHFVTGEGTRYSHVDEITIPSGAVLLLPASEQTAFHDHIMQNIAPALREGRKTAFAAIREITAALLADPETDWSKIDIEGLRQHLIDMDNVTLLADVACEDIDGGARFVVTSVDPVVQASIRAMVMAHVASIYRLSYPEIRFSSAAWGS